MKKSVIVAFLFIVIAPLICVSWLGWRSITSEQERYQAKLMDLQQERLQEFANNQLRWIESLQTSFVQLLESLQRQPYSNWPGIQERNRFAYQLFSVDPDGNLDWPNNSILPLTNKEIDFVQLFQRGKVSLSTANNENSTEHSYLNWSTWFEGPGQQWAFWIRDSRGRILGMVLDRTAFMSEAIAQLPDQQVSPNPSERIRQSMELPYKNSPAEMFSLFNESNEVLYNWGTGLDDTNRSSPIEALFPPPLSMWKLQLSIQELSTPPWYQQSLLMFMAIGITGLSVITIGAAYYLYSETRREFQQARQRVSFVNQVSHEFKTPLTNIQLYADLLEDSLERERDTRYLDVIREESGKLSRMIQNVLTLGRSQKDALRLHPFALIPDQLLLKQLELHRPGLERQAISLNLELKATGAMKLDPECLSQIFSNLLSNAEKYAPSSKLSITTRQKDHRLIITVQDQGPGIARSKQQAIFEPFVRLEDRATEGVSGTGIGLSIARDLARLHGGDLVLEDSETGACFVFNLLEQS